MYYYFKICYLISICFFCIYYIYHYLSISKQYQRSHQAYSKDFFSKVTRKLHIFSWSDQFHYICCLTNSYNNIYNIYTTIYIYNNIYKFPALSHIRWQSGRVCGRSLQLFSVYCNSRHEGHTGVLRPLPCAPPSEFSVCLLNMNINALTPRGKEPPAMSIMQGCHKLFFPREISGPTAT